MLTIDIPDVELFDEDTQTFSIRKGQKLKVEHSLVSLSKWEAHFCKPFLSNDAKSTSETVSYLVYMTVTPNVKPEVYLNVNQNVINKINEYIQAPMTATTFSKTQDHKINRDIITSEIIYYWMIALGVPFECQKWHLNRLLTLINICNIKQQKQKPMTRAELLARQRSLNAARRAKSGSRG